MTRPPIKLIADLLALDREARRDGEAIPLADAFDGPLEKRWHRLEAEMRAALAEQPS